MGLSETTYSGREVESVEVCITVYSPNQTVLAMSNFEGDFIIVENGICMLLYNYAGYFVIPAATAVEYSKAKYYLPI